MRRASCSGFVVLVAFAMSLFSAPITAADAILLVSDKSGNSEIYLHDGAGEPKNLTNHAAHDVFPAWSPDGQRIAFASTRNGAYNIHIMQADGTEVAALTHEAKGSKFSCMCPTWSPDGERIAYVRQEGANSTLISVQIDGDRERVLAEQAWDPAWSPEGDKIVFTSQRELKGWKLYTIEPDGGKLQKILDMPNKVGFVYPAWSPDGKHIALTALAGEGHEIQVCDADGSHLKPLTKLGKLNTHAAWSTDGKTIYFWQDFDASGWRWMQVGLDGAAPKHVSEFPTVKYLHGARLAVRPVVK